MKPNLISLLKKNRFQWCSCFPVYNIIFQDGKCKFDQANVGATATSCKDIWKGSESQLQKAVATEGPIAIGINAGLSSFQLYK